MNEMVRRVAECRATVADYERLMGHLGFEVRPHVRMYRELQMGRLGDTWQGVPDLTSSSDATFWLTTEITGGRFISIIQIRNGWRASWLSYSSEVADEPSSARSNSLGAAMWAAWAGSI